MKLLLDQNLSRRLLADLEPLFPGSSQAALCGLDTASDADFWQYARKHAFAILTKDADFLELALWRGFPPKVIRLNLGNVGNARIRDVLLANADALRGFSRFNRRGSFRN